MKSKIGHAKIALLIAAAFFFVFYSFKESQGFGDFQVFLEASKIFSQSGNPYENMVFVDNNYFTYFYSPFWVFVLMPFNHLPFEIVQFIWLLLSGLFLFRSMILLQKSFGDIKLSTNQQLFIVLVSIGMSMRFILYNLDLVQMTIFLLWGILEVVNLNRSKKYILAGTLLALIVNIKILPLVVLPYLLLFKSFKTMVFFILGTVVFFILPALYVGFDQNMFLHSEWWANINPSNAEHTFETELGPHSLTALVPNLFADLGGEINLRRHLVELSEETAGIIMNIVRTVFVLTPLWIMRKMRTLNFNKIQEVHIIAVLCLLIPLVFPHQQKYAFVLMLPAFYLSLIAIIQEQSKKRRTFSVLILALTFVLTTITTDGILGKELNELSQHYKLITFGAILLLINVLFVVRVSKE